MDIDHTDYTPYVCSTHSPIAGMMHVYPEDLEEVARVRMENTSTPVECDTCGMVYVGNGKWRH